MNASRPLAAIAFSLAMLTASWAGDLASRAWREDAAAGCGAYGTHDCQFVPRLGGDGRPGPVYEGGPRCVWRWTPLGSRRLCRAF